MITKGMQSSITETLEHATALQAAEAAQKAAAERAEAERLANSAPPDEGAKFVCSLPYLRFVLGDGSERAIKAGCLVTKDEKEIKHLRDMIAAGNGLVAEITGK